MTTNHTTTFRIGSTYDTGRGDYVWTFTVIDRTAKFLTLEDEDGKTRRVGVRVSGDREVAMPLGRYSMAPVLAADSLVEVTA